MLLILLAYAVIMWVEWTYLKRNTRKKSTRLWVFAFIGISLAYNVFVYYTKDHFPTPSRLLLAVFEPVQKLLMVD